MKNLLLYSFLLILLSCGEKNATTEVVTAQMAPVQKTTQPVARQAPKATATNTFQPAPSKTRTTPPNSGGDYKPKNEGWHVEFEKAMSESQKTGKPIMANFTGSDWCGWCKRLDKSVFHRPEFKKWAADNVVLLELDFPRRFRLPDNIAQQNQGLARSFGVRGYPTVWVFDVEKDASGQVGIKALGKTGYTKTFNEFKATMDGYIARRPS